MNLKDLMNIVVNQYVIISVRENEMEWNTIYKGYSWTDSYKLNDYLHNEVLSVVGMKDIENLHFKTGRDQETYLFILLRKFRKVEDLNLSVRAYNAIKRAGIQSVEELVDKSEDDMKRLRNLGGKGIKEIKDKLFLLGLTFKSYE